MVQSETHDSLFLVHPWPSSMFHSVGVAMCPDEASKPEETIQRGKSNGNPSHALRLARAVAISRSDLLKTTNRCSWAVSMTYLQ